MKTNNKILMSILGLFIIMSLPMVMGAITFITPSTTGDTVNGTYTFSISTLINATDEEYYCNLSTSTDGHFNSSYNTSSNGVFLISYDTSTLTEIEDTTLTANCSNSTSTEQATLTINIDNTDPTCSFIIDRTAIDRQDGIGIIVTDSSSDTTDLTYAYVLTNDGGTSKATSTSTEPTFSNGDLEDLGQHTLTLTVTDEASKTASCIQTFDITGSGDSDEDAGIIDSIRTTITKSKTGITLFVIIMGVVIVFIFGLAWWMISKTK